jgi:hypothetical protein
MRLRSPLFRVALVFSCRILFAAALTVCAPRSSAYRLLIHPAPLTVLYRTLFMPSVASAETLWLS